MVSTTRVSLPSKREQVQKFVEACGLNPVQAGLVMSVWDKLIAQQVREQETPVSSAEGRAGASDSGRSGTSASDEVPSDEPRPRRRSTSYRPAQFVDLLFLVLEDGDRTRRALWLMTPLLIAFVAIVAIFVWWAVAQPSRAPIIMALLGSTVLAPVSAILRETARARKRPLRPNHR